MHMKSRLPLERIMGLAYTRPGYFIPGNHVYKSLSRRASHPLLKSTQCRITQVRSYATSLDDLGHVDEPGGLAGRARTAHFKRQQEKKTLLRKSKLGQEPARVNTGIRERQSTGPAPPAKVVAGYCAAQEYDMLAVARILRHEGVPIDPTGTSMFPQVIHVELPADPDRDVFGASYDRNFETGDAFIFPSGTVVTWNVPEVTVKSFILEHLKPAANGSHQLEDEDFEYVEDSGRERSTIRSDVIILGTKVTGGTSGAAQDHEGQSGRALRHSNTVLAQIAFSSGLARSTKIAVLENQLNTYLEDTRDIPKTLMDGHLGSLPRSFIYQKMGQLLSIRGQLNLSSDLTDSVPDLLWDTEAELELENYYDRISRELDTRLRIESLNQRMDYAHEIASILREELSVIRGELDERKSTRLEWIIIALIAVEVGFGCWDLYKDSRSGGITDVRVVRQD